jgi:hypothetical protein
MNAIVPILTGSRVPLRRPTSTDAFDRLKIGIQRQIIECYGGTFDPNADFTLNDAEAAIRFIAKFKYSWVIDVGGFIGHIRFHDINVNDRRAIMAIGIESDQFT